MAVVTHLVTRTVTAGDNQLTNDVHAVLIAIDDAVDTTGALIRARALTVANANGYNLPAAYFDANVLVSTFDAAGDHAVFGPQWSRVVA